MASTFENTKIWETTSTPRLICVDTSSFWLTVKWDLIRLNTSLVLLMTVVLFLNFNITPNPVFDKTLHLPVTLHLLVYERDSHIVESQTFTLVNHFLENFCWLGLGLYVLKRLLDFGRRFIACHFHLALLSILQRWHKQLFFNGFLMSVANNFQIQTIFHLLRRWTLSI